MIIRWLPLLLGGCVYALGIVRESTKCCKAGQELFRTSQTCADVSFKVEPIVRTGIPARICRHAGSACCFRTAINQYCDDGKQDGIIGSCQNDKNRPGFFVYKECCDCCKLARELTSIGKPCSAPAAFSNLCRQTFLRCCGLPGDAMANDGNQNSVTRDGQGNRCHTEHNDCEQNCQDIGGLALQCSCRPGFELNQDMKTCRDIDECTEGSGVCGEFERCINRLGSFECVPASQNTNPAPANSCPNGFTYIDGECYDIDECKIKTHRCDEDSQTCHNTRGDYRCDCKFGFKLLPGGKCVDVDECLLFLDSCFPHQRCVNTKGSYRCIRRLSCGTGYQHDEENDECMDIDECAIGTDNCGDDHWCRNIEGSFRCEGKKKCDDTEYFDSSLNKCVKLDCRLGMRPGPSGCEDINECLEEPNVCPSHQRCINTAGSFRCEVRDNFCPPGQKLDFEGFCVDVDECAEGSHNCPQGERCTNTVGGYDCSCPAGYSWHSPSKTCIDRDECTESQGHVCSLHARCENTVGSFKCQCATGYATNADGRSCDDIDECSQGTAGCSQFCRNTPGSFICFCNPGYILGADGKTCEDIDECVVYGGRAGSNLCLGECINTPGSFQCDCPAGFRLKADKRTCEDIDECAENHCPGDDRLCVNLLGSYKCIEATCPENYARSTRYKQFVEDGFLCVKACAPGDTQCATNTTLSISYQYAALPTIKRMNAPIPVTRIRAISLDHRPFSVEYSLDSMDGSEYFKIKQEQREADLMLTKPVEGPKSLTVRVNLNVSNRNRVLIAKDKAIIKVEVSQYSSGYQIAGIHT